MKNQLLLLLIGVAFTGTAISQSTTLPPSGDNQKSIVTQYIGAMVKATVTYNSPNVTAPDGTDRTGKIWGTPVAHYGMVDQGFGLSEPAPWRAGANECTTIQFSHDVMIEGKPLAAGKYGLFLLLSESGPWTWIFSKNSSGWGSYYYRPSDDVLRVDVQPRDNAHTEYLTYTFTDRQGEEATLELQWERKAIPMKITVPNMKDLYVEQLSREFQGEASFIAANYVNAAMYLLQEDHNLPKALEWVNASMEGFFGRVDFQALSTKAQIQLKMGQKAEAMATIEKSIDMPGASASQIHQLGRSLIGLGMKDDALKIFQRNYEKYNGAWPTKVGLVRGLSATGNYKDALKYAESALPEAPDELNKSSLTSMIEKLKAGKDVNL